MTDASLVGNEYWSATIAVEAGAVLRFAEAAGTPARRRDDGVLEAPPAFALVLVPFEALLRLLDAAERQVHGSEQQVEVSRPICAGDRLRLCSRIAEIHRVPTTTGHTEVVTVDDEGRDGTSGELVYRARRIYAVRGAREVA